MASGYMFSHYWPGDGALGGVTVVPHYDYPYWFDGATLGMNLVLPTLPRKWQKRIIHYRKQIWRWVPFRLQILLSVLKLLFSPDLKLAQAAVYDISQNLTTRNMRKWNAVMAERVNADPNVHENVSRFLAAADLMPKMDRVKRDTLLQLAWMRQKNG